MVKIQCTHELPGLAFIKLKKISFTLHVVSPGFKGVGKRFKSEREATCSRLFRCQSHWVLLRVSPRF